MTEEEPSEEEPFDLGDQHPDLGLGSPLSSPAAASFLSTSSGGQLASSQLPPPREVGVR